MTRFVLDASVALAWVVDRNADPYAEFVQRQLRAGARAVVPPLWHLELANTLAMVRRRQILTPDQVEQALTYLETFAATLTELDDRFLSAREAFLVADDLGLTAYDSVYMELAKRERLPLATLDKRLRDAATKAGIKLL